MLWALWNGIFLAATRMREKFSVRHLIETAIDMIGEGQLQDSIVIGFIQFLLTDQNFHCKICKQNFGEEEEIPHLQFDDGDETQPMNDDNEIIQLTCNPTHVYHRRCI